MKKTPLLLFLLWGLVAWLGALAPAYAQAPATGSISGRIVDGAGEGLPGVTILVQGTTKGAATVGDGSFTIRDVPAGTYTLTASSVGMTTGRQQVTVTADGDAVANLSLAEDATQLSEAVVVGYGTVRRQDVTGAVTTVSTKDFVQGQVTNPANLVVGKIAGVVVTPPSGAPGSSAPIRIRGIGSLNASSDPLIVIDGVPVDNVGISGAPDVLSTINPNDIETFTVLKDASATAIYGSRASNGVILITTKKGVSNEKIRVNFSTQYSIGRNYRKVDVLSGDELRSLLLDTTGRDVLRTASRAQRRGLGRNNTDWQNEIFQTSHTTDNNLSVAGAAGILPFRVSLGYLNQQGTLRGGNLKRNTASISLTPSFLDNHLRVEANVKGIWSDNLFANEGAIGSAISFDPTQPVRSGDSRYENFGGYFQYLNPTGTQLVAGFPPNNPVGLLEQRRDRSTVKRAIGNLQLDYKLHFLPDLRAVVNVGYDLARSAGATYIPVNAASNYNIILARSGSFAQYEQKKDNKVLDTYLNYVKTFDSFGGRVDVTAGYSYQDFRYRNPSLLTGRSAIGLLNDTSRAARFSQPTDRGYTLVSGFARANLSYKERYLLTGTVRNDQSSRFDKSLRSGWFPAAALAWRVKEEGFLANVNAVSEFKLRVGYGQTGQQDIGNASFRDFYPYLALYTPGNNQVQYQFGNQFYSTYRAGGYNSKLKWETTKTWNYGVDFGFFDNRVFGSVEYYKRTATDLLAQVNIPAGTNLTNQIIQNIGSVENKGLEVNLNVVPVRNQQVTWTVNANLTRNRNRITKLQEIADANFPGYTTGGIAGGTGSTIQINTVNFPINTFYVLKQKYDEKGRPVESTDLTKMFVDMNGDGKITLDDRYRSNSPNPDLTLGFSSNLTYRKISLAFTMRSNIGGYIYDNVSSNSAYYKGIIGSPDFLRNTTHDIYDTNFFTDKPERRLSDYYIKKASFVRMDNVTLAYEFGQIMRRTRQVAGATDGTTTGSSGPNLRVTFAVQNAFLVTKYKGVDPEVFGGIDNNFYPRPRIYTLGLNFAF